MIRKHIDQFTLSQICQSGQCFRMTALEDGLYSVIAGNRYLEIKQHDDECEFYCEEQEYEDFWKHYFDLGNDYSFYLRQIDGEDRYLQDAAGFGSGIRILRQDLWEMIVSFLISQQNNIVRIRRCIRELCETYGEKCVDFHGKIYYAFPKPEDLADLDEDALKACNLGYRSKYVVRTARSIVNKEADLEKILNLPYVEARAELMKLYGVGQKVADCICLFALHHLEAFPVDTHIQQALDGHYQTGFPNDRYQGYQGVLQQYIFYYELCGKNNFI